MRIAFFIGLLLLALNAASQNVGIGTTTPEPSARLDVTSSSQGILFPRVTTAERNAIPNPATGLMVFDKEKNVPYYFNGTRWMPLGPIQPKDVSPIEFSSQQTSNTNEFGKSVGMSNGYAAVGIPGYDSAGVLNIGAVVIYKKNNGVWAQNQIVIAPDTATNDNFGTAIDMDGDYLVVGAHKKSVLATTASGKVYVFKLNSGTGLYEIDGQLTHPSGLIAGSYFGWSVAITTKSPVTGGVAVAVGSPTYTVSGTSKGTVSIFKRNSANSYSALNTINGVQTTEYFGHSVDIDSNLVVIGAPLFDTTIASNLVSNIGRVQINRYSGSNYSTVDAVLRPSSDTSASYGYSVAIDSNTIFTAGINIGTQLNSYPKNIARTGPGTYVTYNTFNHILTDFEGNASSVMMGYQIGLTRNFVLIGIPHYYQTPTGSGHNFTLVEYGLLYKRNPGQSSFSFYTQLFTPSKSINTQMGMSVAADGKDYIISAPNITSSDGYSGAVYFGTIEE